MEIGIDCCKSGWFAVKLDDIFKEGYDLELYPSVYSIWHDLKERAGVTAFVDIPIGLPEDGSKRRCDTQARKKTKKYSSVYPVPSRKAAYEDTYPKAKSKNEAASDKSLSTQTWGIIPQVREMDEVLQDHEAARGTFHESHPEVCFWSLNDGEPLGNSKKGEEGEKLRRSILDKFDDSYPIEKIANEFRTEYEDGRASMVSVGIDDMYDATVLALSASAEEYEILPEKSGIPDEIPEDNQGIPMTISYARPQSV